MTEPFRFEYEMAETRESLARGLVRLLGAKGETIARGETRLEITEGTKRLVLEIADLPPRKFGSMSLPRLRVAATLVGYAPGETETFKRDFERAFQRGGG